SATPPEGDRSQGDQISSEGRRARLSVQEEAHRAVPRGRRQGEGDDLLSRTRDGTPRDWSTDPRASRAGTFRRGGRRIDAAAGGQPDAHDLEPPAASWKTKSERSGDEVNGMPKLKTHRGAAKRFKRTKGGKFLRSKAFKQHILSSKTRKRKRA